MYDRAETVMRIFSMMIENTGKALCDSGDAYGRNWEANREKGLPTETKYPVEHWDGELDLTLNIYPFLCQTLLFTEKANDIEKQLWQLCPDHWAIWEIEDALKEIQDLYDFDYVGEWVNTYNYCGIQSQILQFIRFGNEFNEEYVLLQIHGGCDARGGYTEPKMFQLDGEGFYNLDSMLITCECGEIDYIIRDIGGYTEFDEGDMDEFNEKVYIDGDYLRCKECGEIVMQEILTD